MYNTIHLIFNPVSGQGNAQEDLELLRSRLSPIFDLTIYETSPECNANELVAQSVEQGVDLVVVSGGDGTINAAAEALVETSIPLAIIPRGTANAVASALGIPTNLEEACELVLTGEAHPIDAARCNGMPMVLLAGIGLEAGVVERASRSAKDRLGVLAYMLAGIQELRELEPFEVTLQTDDKVLSIQACAVTVANMAPPTSILAQGPESIVADDGFLDITIVAPKGFGGALAASYELFRSAMSGEAAQREGIGFLRSKAVKIATQPAQQVVLDGEMAGETPIEVVCLPQALNVVLPGRETLPKEEDLTRLPELTVNPEE